MLIAYLLLLISVILSLGRKEKSARLIAIIAFLVSIGVFLRHLGPLSISL